METKQRSKEEILKGLKQIDPIGEIRSLAETLFKEAGTPTGRDWLDYFSEAETMLLSGRGHAEVGKKKPVTHIEPCQADPLLEELRSQNTDVLLSILASSFGHFLSEHDSLCLANILLSNRFDLKDGTHIGPCEIARAGALLAELADEYAESFLKTQKVSRGMDAPLEKRVQYWNDKLAAVNQADEPLTYADRDAVVRIRRLIEAEKRVATLKLVP